MANRSFQPLNSLELAAYIIRQCQNRNIDVNVTKTQKIAYCAYGAVLALYQERLVSEYPVAYQYGPVFVELLSALQFFDLQTFAAQQTPNVDNLPNHIKNMIDKTIVMFGQFSPTQLINWLTSDGTPWAKTTKGGCILYGRIKDDVTSEWFYRVVIKH